MDKGGSRLSSGIEVAGLLRRVEASGDFAVVLRKGDEDRGAMLVLVAGCFGTPRDLGEV